MIEVKQKVIEWLKEILEEGTVELRREKLIKETSTQFSDYVDAWKMFITYTDFKQDVYGWDVSEKPDVLSVTVYNPDQKIVTSVKKWDTWEEDIKSTYGIHFLYPDTEHREFFNNRKEWEDRINELDPDFPWEPAVPLMVYCGHQFIATIDYDLIKKEDD